MNIRPATPADLPALMEIFALARRFMAEHGNPGQWPTSYPDGALMRGQIESGVCYVCEVGGEIQGTFCLIFGDDPTYEVILDGAWPDDAPYATIHRLPRRANGRGWGGSASTGAAGRPAPCGPTPMPTTT